MTVHLSKTEISILTAIDQNWGQMATKQSVIRTFHQTDTNFAIQDLVDRKLLIENNGVLSISSKGLAVLNELAPERKNILH